MLCPGGDPLAPWIKVEIVQIVGRARRVGVVHQPIGGVGLQSSADGQGIPGQRRQGPSSALRHQGARYP